MALQPRWVEADIPENVEAARLRFMNAAHRVHRTVGPGYRESVYVDFLAQALRNDGVRFAREVPFPVSFEGLTLPRAMRADFVVEDVLLVEVKSVDVLHPTHEAQVVSYLKASGLLVGILLNLNARFLKQGYRRLVHPDFLKLVHAP